MEWLDQYFIIISNHIHEGQSHAFELWFADIFLEWTSLLLLIL